MKLMAKCLLCLLILSMALPATAFAGDTTSYAIEELGLTLTLPSGLVVFGRHIDADDPNLALYKTDAQALETQYRNSNVYLNAFPPQMNYEVVVTMVASPDIFYPDLASMPDELMPAAEEALRTSFQSIGVTSMQIDRYTTPQASYLRLRYERENAGSPVYSLQFYTFFGQQVVNLTLHSYGEPITAEQEALLQGIVDTAVYTAGTTPAAVQTPAPQPSAAPLAPSTYVDKKVGVQFTVPAGWRKKALFQESSMIDVKYVNDSANIILFGCMDIWEASTAEEKAGKTRSNFNNDMFTLSELAQYFQSIGLKNATAEYEMINGIQYARIRWSQLEDVDLANLDMEMSAHAFANNGWLYLYQFGGKADSTAYQDYLAVLSSVQYDDLPVYSPTEIMTPAVPKLPAKTSAAAALEILASLIIAIILYTVPIVIYRYAIRKEPVAQATAKKIAILYGIIVFVGILALNFALSGKASSGGVLLWSYVNYRILKSGKSRTEPAAAEAQKATAQDSGSPEQLVAPVAVARFCVHCGRELLPSSSFCTACGTNVHQNTL